MAEIVYFVATTIDNFICDEDGGIDSFLPQGDHIPDFFEQIKQYETVLMGRKTYEFGYCFGMKPGQPGYEGIKHYVER